MLRSPLICRCLFLISCYFSVIWEGFSSYLRHFMDIVLYLTMYLLKIVAAHVVVNEQLHLSLHLHHYLLVLSSHRANLELYTLSLRLVIIL